MLPRAASPLAQLTRQLLPAACCLPGAVQDQSLAKQGELQAGQEGMSRLLSDGSSRLESLFGFIDDHAQKQLEMQRQHEEQQALLTSDLK